jgi:hypothetical protein
LSPCELSVSSEARVRYSYTRIHELQRVESPENFRFLNELLPSSGRYRFLPFFAAKLGDAAKARSRWYRVVAVDSTVIVPLCSCTIC